MLIKINDIYLNPYLVRYLYQTGNTVIVYLGDQNMNAIHNAKVDEIAEMINQELEKEKDYERYRSRQTCSCPNCGCQ